MTLAFESARVPIPQSTGVFSTGQNRSFPDDVRIAEIAIKSFKLDYVGGARPSDVAQVTASIDNIGSDTVDFSVKVNYSGGPYSGEVVVLIIADLQ